MQGHRTLETLSNTWGSCAYGAQVLHKDPMVLVFWVCEVLGTGLLQILKDNCMRALLPSGRWGPKILSKTIVQSRREARGEALLLVLCADTRVKDRHVGTAQDPGSPQHRSILKSEILMFNYLRVKPVRNGNKEN